MKIDDPHPWKLTPTEAIALQGELRARVIRDGDPGEVTRVAGVDVAFPRGTGMTRAAVVVLDFPTLAPLDQSVAEQPTTMPYIPGLLSFREVPTILAALRVLETPPDVLLCDGQGVAHPRRLGLAAHLGLVTGIPSIGVAKSRLIGTHAPLADERGARVPLMDGDERVGAVLRTRTGVRPLYISVGHLISLERAIDLVLACTPRYRLPETTRLADRLAGGK